MRQVQKNFLIDGLAFVCGVLLLSTGGILRFLLPPGSGGLHGVGTGLGAAERPITLLWGLTRHEWGAIHFWVALILIGILAMHLFEHFRWIIQVARSESQMIGRKRLLVILAVLLALTVLAAAPFFTPTRRIPRKELQQMRSPTGVVESYLHQERDRRHLE